MLPDAGLNVIEFDHRQCVEPHCLSLAIYGSQPWHQHAYGDAQNDARDDPFRKQRATSIESRFLLFKTFHHGTMTS